MCRSLCLFLFTILFIQVEARHVARITSPDRSITVNIDTKEGRLFYTVTRNQVPVLEASRLGIDFSKHLFSENLQWQSVSPVALKTETYTTENAKKSKITYKANVLTLTLTNEEKLQMQVIFRVSNDGLAFRYYFPWVKTSQTITREYSSFTFDPDATGWLQPMSEAKTGWEHCHPSYEERYLQNVAVGTIAPLRSGWVYPALFKTNDTWVLITEADLDGNYCGTRLLNDSASSNYTIGFPGPLEVFTGGGHLPQHNQPWYTPWRVITVGSLKTIVESTLGMDLAPNNASIQTGFVKMGKASWSWINSKDDNITYEEQKKYIDFAADMKGQYCLIDVNWDTKIGFEKIKELVAYGKQKNVGLILWYNSAGDWNTVKYHPKDMLLTKESREQEFSKLQAMGVKGVKIDFFGGDGQSMIRYYIDILKDAAKYELLVNFHGATLPRGWQKTYPHLVTAEAVNGMEMVTFSQEAADRQASHCTLLPFTRNAFDPMDFTPMNLTGLTGSNSLRKTTATFELALSVLFLSGIQHYAQSPEGMKAVPLFVKRFLQTLPDHWEDVRFIDGYPGKYVIIARRSGNKWYIAGINGEDSPREVALDLSRFNKKSAKLIEDSDSDQLFRETSIDNTLLNLQIKSRGGFVVVLE